MEISVTEEVQSALDNLGRTEDIKFSPSERRLAIVGFLKHKILLVDVTIESSGDNKRIMLTDYLEITSPGLRLPHGISFLNEETIVVANREGDVTIFDLPNNGSEVKEIELQPIEVIGKDSFSYLYSPGSVAISRLNSDFYEMFVCNVYARYVTRHILDGRDRFRLISSAVVLRKDIDVPDGVALNRNGEWLAISIHDSNRVFLFRNKPELDSMSRPDGVLDKIKYPHGVRFTSDDNYMLVADAGKPYVHLFAKGGESWTGMRDPVTSIKVMDDENFMEGNYNPQEGGPKGIDIHSQMNVFVTTSDKQVLAFHDLEKILSDLELETAHSFDRVDIENQVDDTDDARSLLIRELERVNHLHSLQEVKLEENHRKKLLEIRQSRSWKITAPLRWVSSKLSS